MNNDNLTSCPHCMAAIKTTDTTCCQCGEAVSPSVQDAPQTEPEPKRHQRKIVSAIFYVAVLACAVLFTMWAKGEL